MDYHNKYNNGEKVWNIVSITKMWNRHESSKYCWENGTNKFVPCRVATNLQFIKTAISAKHNKAQFNKMRHACIWKTKELKHERHPTSLNSEVRLPAELPSPRVLMHQKALQGGVGLYPISPLPPPPTYSYSWALKKSLSLVTKTLQRKGSTWGAMLPNFPAKLCWQNQGMSWEQFFQKWWWICADPIIPSWWKKQAPLPGQTWRCYLLPLPWEEGTTWRTCSSSGLPHPFSSEGHLDISSHTRWCPVGPFYHRMSCLWVLLLSALTSLWECSWQQRSSGLCQMNTGTHILWYLKPIPWLPWAFIYSTAGWE